MSVPFLTPAIIVGMMIGCFAVLQGETLEKSKPAHRLIIVWDDADICCGPGTMAGMDSPEANEQMVRRQTPLDDGPAFDNLRITRDLIGIKR